MTSASSLHPDVEQLLDRLVPELRSALDDELIALYLFGSAVAGAFEPGISDVDLVAVLASDPTDRALEHLAIAHREIVDDLPAWDDRVEVVYVSRRALAGSREGTFPAARISPGEPFHSIEVDASWVLDWYRVREIGLALVGPPPSSFIPPIDDHEYRDAVRSHLLAWPRTLDANRTRGSQAYAIMTMCRGLMTVRTGAFASKADAVAWGIDELPQHADLIRSSIAWRGSARRSGDVDGAPTLARTLAFIDDVQRILVDG